MIGRKNASTKSRTPSPDSSRESSPCEDRDDRSSVSTTSTMSSRNTSPRPLTVAIPASLHTHGPHCSKRPALSEILANRAPPPYTLSAFMAYLSQNHCLETLEFTMDASRYRKHYGKMLSHNQSTPLSPADEEVQYVRMLWQKLVEAYIAPNGPREVNLPSEVRDSLMHMNATFLPPSPTALDSAVNHVYALMEESVLVPFLNSVGPLTAHTDSTAVSDDSFYGYANGFETTSIHRRRVQERLSSPPLSTPSPYTYSPHPSMANRASAPSTLSQFARSLSNSARMTARESFHNSSHIRALHLTTSPSSGTNSEAVTDDSSVSTNSPSIDGAVDIITPPTTPPMSDFCSYSPTTSSSPRHSRGEAWKKMGAKLGWRKKSTSEDDVEDITMCAPHNY